MYLQNIVKCNLISFEHSWPPHRHIMQYIKQDFSLLGFSFLFLSFFFSFFLKKINKRDYVLHAKPKYTIEDASRLILSQVSLSALKSLWKLCASRSNTAVQNRQSLKHVFFAVNILCNLVSITTLLSYVFEWTIAFTSLNYSHLFGY